MKKYLMSFGIGIMTIILLSGCMYPNSEKAKNQVPNEEQLASVQKAVDAYKEEKNGLIPIKTKDNDVDYYEKYLIDFSVLEEAQLISEAPGTAYESGGIYQYSIIDPEESAEVKLIDLRLSEKMREVKTKLHIYRSKHQFPPFGEKLSKHMFKLNYSKLGYDEEPVVTSPYSHHNLPFVIDGDGEVFIDYRIDLNQAIDEFGKDDIVDDPREILTNHYPFVPVYSSKYEVKGDEVDFLD